MPRPKEITISVCRLCYEPWMPHVRAAIKRNPKLADKSVGSVDKHVKQIDCIKVLRDANRGPAGPRGFQGPVGTAGATGVQGPMGPQGPKGDSYAPLPYPNQPYPFQPGKIISSNSYPDSREVSLDGGNPQGSNL